MVFKLSLSKYALWIAIVFVASFFVLVFWGADSIETCIVFIVSYIFVLLTLYFKHGGRYVIQDNRILVRTFGEEFIIEINDIAYIRERWFSGKGGNISFYEIIMKDSYESPIKIDINLHNSEGKALSTVLANEYDIRLNIF